MTARFTFVQNCAPAGWLLPGRAVYNVWCGERTGGFITPSYSISQKTTSLRPGIGRREAKVQVCAPLFKRIRLPALLRGLLLSGLVFA